MSNLVIELVLRLVKPLAATVLGLIVFIVAVGLGEAATIGLALLAWLVGAAFVLLVQEGPL